MKTIKTLFVVLFLSSFFMACEADAVNDEVGIDNIDTSSEDEADTIEPAD